MYVCKNRHTKLNAKDLIYAHKTFSVCMYVCMYVSACSSWSGSIRSPTGREWKRSSTTDSYSKPWTPHRYGGCMYVQGVRNYECMAGGAPGVAAAAGGVTGGAVVRHIHGNEPARDSRQTEIRRPGRASKKSHITHTCLYIYRYTCPYMHMHTYIQAHTYLHIVSLRSFI